MSDEEQTQGKIDESVSERFIAAIGLVDSSPQDAIGQLEQIQKDVATLALFSSNETIDDISTKSLPLTALDFHLAMAHLGVSAKKSTQRKSHVTQGMNLLNTFLQRMEQLELLSKEHIRDYHELLDITSISSEQQQQDVTTDHVDVAFLPRRIPAGGQEQQREKKIARFRAKQQAQNEVNRLRSLQQRRGRLLATCDEEEQMDGYDQESLERQVALTTLSVLVAEALDEWYQALRELPMIEMAITMEQQQERHYHHGGGAILIPKEHDTRQPPPRNILSGSNKPLQLTHITQDTVTGQLQIRKEEIRSQVFRPGWNQPTMTLQEFGELEMKAAMEREARQKISEAEQRNAPRRYEFLVRDGLEDNADLVDASAQLDRDWDKFKDENPRKSGNKMGDRGDRNFWQNQKTTLVSNTTQYTNMSKTTFLKAKWLSTSW